MKKLADISTFESLMNSSSCGRVSSFNAGAAKGKIDEFGEDGQLKGAQALYVTVNPYGNVDAKGSLYDVNKKKWGAWKRPEKTEIDGLKEYLSKSYNKNLGEITSDELKQLLEEDTPDAEWVSEEYPNTFKENFVDSFMGPVNDILPLLSKLGGKAAGTASKIFGNGEAAKGISEFLRLLSQSGIDVGATKTGRGVRKWVNVLRAASEGSSALKSFFDKLSKNYNKQNSN